ncbi:MAG TPA: glycosyltransferase family 1 protein [Thermoanaerobaculia bacterium]|nr:glycosyltransferase family 1 protein [Thermoanaerobaculia bacterium]
MPLSAARTISRIVDLLAHTATQRVLRAIDRAPRKLRIGFDIRPFYEPLTGVGWYLYHLLRELAARDDVTLVALGDACVSSAGPHLYVDLPVNVEHLFFDLRDRPPSTLDRQLTAAAFLPLIRLADCDLIFGGNYFLPRLMSAVARRRVITIHDLTYKRYPDLVQKETLANLERQMTNEIFAADAIICVSDATRRDVLGFYEVDAAKIVAIHSGVEPPGAVSGNFQTPEAPYVLFVGTVEPRKDIDTLIAAFEILKDRGGFEGSLVIVGSIGWKSEGTMRRMRRSRWKESILHLSYLEAAALSAVYRKAAVLAFPSLHEGFGFPLLEAMAHGVPVVAANNSSLPEVGGDAALYFRTGDAGELASLIERVVHDPALSAAMVEKGRARLDSFQWKRAAEETMKVFRRVAEL